MRITDFPIIEEIKTEYCKYRESGLGRADTISALQQDYHKELTNGEADDGICFWLAVADAQYICRELSEDIAQKGLGALHRLALSGWNIAPSDIERRMKCYSSAPMAERKVIKLTQKFRCAWNIGDTYAYQLWGDKWESVSLAGTYMLLRKVSDTEFGDGRLLPVVSFSHWPYKSLPVSDSEFQMAPMLRLWCGFNGQYRDKYQYRTQLLFSSRKMLDKISLQYVGCFDNVKMPEDEIIVLTPGSIRMTLPQKLDHELFLYWNFDQHYRKN